MKIKILLAGNNASRIKFIENLKPHVDFKLGAASVSAVGTGMYTFRLGDDDIEIFFIEDYKPLQKNYKTYAIAAKAIILVDADAETETALRNACPKGTPVTKNEPGKEIDAIAGVKLVVELVYARQARLAGNPQTVFQIEPAKKTESLAKSNNQGGQSGINFELMKQFIDQTPKRTCK